MDRRRFLRFLGVGAGVVATGAALVPVLRSVSHQTPHANKARVMHEQWAGASRYDHPPSWKCKRQAAFLNTKIDRRLIPALEKNFMLYKVGV